MPMAETFDAIVIGGGVIGASVLFQLTKLGCRHVLLLEKRDIASGMTAHSSGIVRTHYSVPINVEVARASLRMLENFRALLDDDPDADAGLVRSGYIIVAPPGMASDAVRNSIAMQQSLGVDAQLLDRTQALTKHPWLMLDDIDAIGFEAEAGFADPYLVTTSFIRAAKRRGATVRTNTKVVGLLHEGDRVVGAQTESGAIYVPPWCSQPINVWSQEVAHWAGLDIPCDITAHHVFTLAADRPYTPDLPVLKDLASAARLYMRGEWRPPAGGGQGTRASRRLIRTWRIWHPMSMPWSMRPGRQPTDCRRSPRGGWCGHGSGLYDTTPDWNPVLGPVPGIDGIQLAFGFSEAWLQIIPDGRPHVGTIDAWARDRFADPSLPAEPLCRR